MNVANSQSLRTYLTSPNPPLTSYEVTSKTNSSNRSWARPHKLERWEDFDIQSLQSMYNGRLDKVLEEHHDLHNFADLPRFPFCQIFDENSFERFLVKWTQSVVTEALQVAQKDAMFKGPSMVYMVSGGQARYRPQVVVQNTPEPTKISVKRSYPDWAAVRFQAQSSGLQNRRNAAATSGVTYSLLPGDTKISAKWTSVDVRPGYVEEMAMESLLPVIQIYNYCLATESRYGYLITDKELFVVRIRPSQESPGGESSQGKDSQENSTGQNRSKTVSHLEAKSQSSKLSKQKEQEISKYKSIIIHDSEILKRTRRRGVLEYKSIPWNQKGENRLTINLALFWLHILASVENSIQDEYAQLSAERIGDAQDDPPNDVADSGSILTPSVQERYSGMSLSHSASSSDAELHSPTTQVHSNSSRNRKRSRPSNQDGRTRKRRSQHDKSLK